MPGHFYLNGGIGPGEDDDPIVLHRVATTLADHGYPDARNADGGGPFAFNQSLQQAIEAFERNEGLPPTGKIERNSPTFDAFHELANGMPKAARLARLSFPHAFDGEIGDGVDHDPKMAAQLRETLHVLGKSPKRPRDYEYALFDHDDKRALEDFQAEHGLPPTGRLKARDATYNALIAAVDVMLDDNKDAIADYERKLARNASGTRPARDERPRAQLASFGPDDFSGFGVEADSEKPPREVPMLPDAYFEPDWTTPPGDTADDAEGPSFWERIFRPAPDAPPKRSGPTQGERGDRPDKDETDSTKQRDPRPDTNNTEENGQIVLAQSKEPPATPEDQHRREQRFIEQWMEFRRNSPNFKPSFPSPEEVEAIHNAFNSERVLPGSAAMRLYAALGSPDLATQVAAARAIAEIARRMPEEARGRFFFKSIEFAAEIDRLARDPALADDPKALIEEARKNGFTNGHAESLLPFIFFAPSGRARPPNSPKSPAAAAGDLPNRIGRRGEEKALEYVQKQYSGPEVEIRTHVRIDGGKRVMDIEVYRRGQNRPVERFEVKANESIKTEMQNLYDKRLGNVTDLRVKVDRKKLDLPLSADPGGISIPGKNIDEHFSSMKRQHPWLDPPRREK